MAVSRQPLVGYVLHDHNMHVELDDAVRWREFTHIAGKHAGERRARGVTLRIRTFVTWRFTTEGQAVVSWPRGTTFARG